MSADINRMAHESGLWLYGLGKDQENFNFFVQKFAELIVRECADVASINAHQWKTPGTYVLEHFGIK